jgi:hypothetical protein
LGEVVQQLSSWKKAKKEVHMTPPLSAKVLRQLRGLR